MHCYFPVILRYEVIEKLGWGAFSTVWKCKDLKNGRQRVAVKVAKRNSSATAQAKDEVKLLECSAGAGNGIGSESVVKMVGHFEVKGPHGVHICIALELLGPSVLSCLPEEGMCLENVKVVMKQVLEGLHFLHTKAQIIHTDIKPENVLIMGCPPETDSFKEPVLGLRVKVADLGSSCWVNEKFSVKIGTQEYRAPEVLLQADYDTAADIWSSACLAFELATGDYLFKPKDASAPEELFTKEEDHLALITELIGPLPAGLLKRGHWRKYFESTSNTDSFKHISDLEYKSLNKMLVKDYRWKADTAEEFSSWLLPMLKPFPEDRVTALESSYDPFIQVTQSKSSPERKKLAREGSQTADVQMACLAPKLKSKGHPMQKKSGQVFLPKSKVTKLRDREKEIGSQFLRSGTPMQKKKWKKSGKQVLLPKVNVVKLRDREELGTTFVRSGTPMSRKLRAPLERPKERQRQAEMRHQTTANLSPIDDLIPTGSTIQSNLFMPKGINSCMTLTNCVSLKTNFLQLLKMRGRMECAAAKRSCVTLVGFKLFVFCCPDSSEPSLHSYVNEFSKSNNCCYKTIDNMCTASF